MAEQYKNKHLASDAVDGRVLKIKKNQAVRAVKQDGSEVDLIKLGASDEVLLKGQEVASKASVDAEALARQSGDAATLSGANAYSDTLMSAEVDARNAAISVAVIAEREARELFDGMFDANLNQEILDRQAADEQLSEQITSTASSLMGTLNAVYSDLMGEVAAREAGDAAALASANSYTDSAVADLVNSSPAALDTLKELSDALGSDPNFATTVSTQIGTISSGLTSEASTRAAADSALQSSIASVSSSISSIQSSVTSVLAKLDATVYYHELHVNFDYTGSTVDGSEYAPYKTIQAAVDASAGPGRIGANTVIYLHPKKNTSVSENVTISAAANNLFIKALASDVDTAQIVINGQFKITGTSVRVRLQGFQISSPSGTPCLIVDGSNGAHSFIDMDFAGGGGVQFINTWKSWHQFVDCGITGSLSLGGTPSAQSIVTLYRLRGFCAPVVSHANATLSIIEAYSLAGLTHSAGNVSLMRVSGPTGNYNSTASFPAVFGMVDCSMQKSDLSFARINKTGTGLFFLSNVNRDEANDVLSGTRTNLGATIADAKFVPSVAASWSSSVISAKAALDEVMAKAKTVESGLASEITTARSAESALGSRVTTLEGSITTKSYIDSQDSAKLVEAKAYTDSKIAAIPPVDLSGYYTKTEVDSSVASEASARQAADAILQAAIDAKKIEFGKSSKILAASASSVTLDHKANHDSLIVFLDCQPLHLGKHFTANSSGAATVLTFIGDVAPGEIQAVEEGETIHATYAKA